MKNSMKILYMHIVDRYYILWFLTILRGKKVAINLKLIQFA